MNKHNFDSKFIITNITFLVLVIITTYLFRDDLSIVKKALMWYACLLAGVNLLLFYKKKTLPFVLVLCIVIWCGLGIILMGFFSFMTMNIYNTDDSYIFFCLLFAVNLDFVL